MFAVAITGSSAWASQYLFNTLAVFNGTNGQYPYSALVIDDNGDFFGTTNDGGALGVGTVFKVAADTHALRTLTTFNNMNGANPYAGLILGTDGNLYGTTASGGTNNMGTVFTVIQ